MMKSAPQACQQLHTPLTTNTPRSPTTFSFTCMPIHAVYMHAHVVYMHGPHLCTCMSMLCVVVYMHGPHLCTCMPTFVYMLCTCMAHVCMHGPRLCTCMPMLCVHVVYMHVKDNAQCGHHHINLNLQESSVRHDV